MSAQAFGSDRNADARELLRLSLNATEIEQYYHFDDKPERLPLKVINHSPYDLVIDFQVAGHPAEIIQPSEAHDSALEIESIEFEPNGANVAIQFAAEGIRAKAMFSKQSGNWVLHNMSIFEH